MSQSRSKFKFKSTNHIQCCSVINHNFGFNHLRNSIQTPKLGLHLKVIATFAKQSIA